jgi:carboxymethylenebutenolidase
MRTDSLSFETAGGATTAYTAIPDSNTNKAVLVIQEYWGVNDHIKDVANRWAAEGFIAVVPDLYRGKVATNPADAAKMMQALQIDDGIDIIQTAMNKARDAYDLTHFGINGFCMGGTYSLRAACLLEGLSASAPFYGDIPEEDILQKLTVPTIFVSATKDKWINPEKVAQLEDITERYELPITSVKYEADHAFFNNTRTDVYNETAARDAWALVTGFFNDRL